MRLIVDNMANVFKEAANASKDTRDPHAIKPPNHVVQRKQAPAVATPAAGTTVRLLAVIATAIVMTNVDARDRAGMCFAGLLAMR